MTFLGAKVRKPLLAESGVIDKGNIVVFDGCGSFTLPNSCADVASVRKAITGVQGRIPRHAKNGVFVLRRKEKELGAFGELSIANPGSQVPGEAPEVAPNVSARGADDVDMGDEVALRGVGDAEFFLGDELREPRLQNSPSDPMSQGI